MSKDVNGNYESDVTVSFRTGESVAVVGPNGVGKSALVEEFGRALKAQSDTEQFSGFRQIYFQSDDVDQIGLSLETFRMQLHHQQVNRMRNPWGEQHLKSVIRRIINRQNQDNNDLIAAIRTGKSVASAEEEQALIIDELNGVFEAGRLAVRILLHEGSLRAKRGNNIYGIDRMSDGERAALLLVGAILIRPTDSRIIIDEPERHLNPAISGPLIGAALRARPDLGYIFATHDLDLLEWISPAQTIHVSDSEVINVEPEIRRYKLEVVGNTYISSESLRSAVFGSRRALLLVEGENSSSDEALFGLLYEFWNVAGRGGWQSVATEVKGINNNSDLHWLNVAGLIDGDGRDQQEIEQLKQDSIFCLPFPTIENLFFYEPIVKAMIELDHSVSGGVDVNTRMTNYTTVLKASVDKAKDDIVHRRVVWRVNRELSARKVSVKAVRNGQDKVPELDLNPIKDSVVRDIEAAIKTGSGHEIITRVPIKNTNIPANLSSEIGFENFNKYKQAVIHQIQIASPSGKAMKVALQSILPTLPSLGLMNF